jgi:hypothetical protein
LIAADRVLEFLHRFGFDLADALPLLNTLIRARLAILCTHWSPRLATNCAIGQGALQRLNLLVVDWSAFEVERS